MKKFLYPLALFLCLFLNIKSYSQCSVTIEHGDVSCYGYNDGWATANVTGGIPPYSYLWSNMETTQNITNLTAGEYYVTVTDAGTCDEIDSVTIEQPEQLMMIITPWGDTICIDQTSYLTANAAGGVAPYTYLWNNAATSQSITVNPQVTTNYSVTVTDGTG